EFALAAEAAPNNMNGWIEEEEEEEDLEMEQEEDPEMEEEKEEMDVDADEEWDDPEWMLPYQGADPLNPLPPASDSKFEIEFEEAEAEAEAKAAPMPPPHIPTDHEPEAEAATVGTGRLVPLTRLFTNTQEAPYVLPYALTVLATHDDPRDPYVTARDAATAPATDNNDPIARGETSPSEPQGSPPHDS
ncbi:hypothetical protein Tco_1350310, partial [Tanacetum coccineum]